MGVTLKEMFLFVIVVSILLICMAALSGCGKAKYGSSGGSDPTVEVPSEKHSGTAVCRDWYTDQVIYGPIKARRIESNGAIAYVTTASGRRVKVCGDCYFY